MCEILSCCVDMCGDVNDTRRVTVISHTGDRILDSGLIPAVHLSKNYFGKGFDAEV